MRCRRTRAARSSSATCGRATRDWRAIAQTNSRLSLITGMSQKPNRSRPGRSGVMAKSDVPARRGGPVKAAASATNGRANGRTRSNGPADDHGKAAEGTPPPLAESTTEGAAESLAGGDPVGIPSAGAVVGSLAKTFGQGPAVARESVRLAAEIARIARGKSEIA